MVKESTAEHDLWVPVSAHPHLKRLGDRVRTLRRARELSQEALADACGIDRSYMSGIERGQRNVSVLHLYRLTKGSGVPVRNLFDR